MLRKSKTHASDHCLVGVAQWLVIHAAELANRVGSVGLTDPAQVGLLQLPNPAEVGSQSSWPGWVSHACRGWSPNESHLVANRVSLDWVGWAFQG